MEKKITDKTFTQKSYAKSELRKFEIYNKNFIKITTQSLLGEKSYHLNLGILEPWPIGHRQLCWQWLAAVIGFSLATFASSLYMYIDRQSSNFGFTIPIFSVLLLCTLGSLLVFLYRSPNVVEFRSRYGGCKLVSLLSNKPNKRSYQSFIVIVKNRILTASQSMNIDQKQMLAIELKELRRLATEGILTDDEYATAKERLMRMHY